MTTETETEVIRWENFVQFVRQLSHDLRNQLNAAELQAALISELTSDAELKGEVMRLRNLVSHLGATLQRLSSTVAPPHPTRLPYAAKDLVADLQKKFGRDFSGESGRLKWQAGAVEGAMLNIDPGLIEAAATELLDNAVRYGNGGAIQIGAREEEGDFIFEVLQQCKAALNPADWHEPLREVRHGHYGLGLRRARAIVAANGGELNCEFDPGSCMLKSSIVLPCSTTTV